MRLVYSFIIWLYGLSFRIVALFNQKAKDWYYGRRYLFSKLDEVFTAHQSDENPSPVIWIHCASLGEYEQGRPVIQEIKKQFPGYLILLTFFSPSGFNNRSGSSDADYVFYLPIDTQKNARRFIKIVSPAIAIFVKYEFWFNYLNELHKSNIPVYTISAIFRPDQHFFKWYGGWFRKHLRNLKMIFVQDDESSELLQMIDVNNVKICGDTRFDRVSRILNNTGDVPFIEKFSENHFLIVAGSTWPQDEDKIASLIKELPDIKVILAPHEVTQHHINELISKFPETSVLYSKVNHEVDIMQYRVLIIDSIGLLSQLYKYGHITYIGGGFGVGIHNTLEAAVYGKPVIFGPNYMKFREARELISCEAAVSIKSYEELKSVVKSFINSLSKLEKYSMAAASYVQERTGATSIIMAEIEGLITDELSV